MTFTHPQCETYANGGLAPVSVRELAHGNGPRHIRRVTLHAATAAAVARVGAEGAAAVTGMASVTPLFKHRQRHAIVPRAVVHNDTAVVFVVFRIGPVLQAIQRLCYNGRRAQKDGFRKAVTVSILAW